MRSHAFFGRFLRGVWARVRAEPTVAAVLLRRMPPGAVARQREAKRLRELLERVLPDNPGRFE